jgi:signal peptidase I
LVDLGSTVALLAAWWILLSPVAVGGKTSFVVVQGQSMEPWYSTGDLVVARAASEYRVDDVVVFRSSDRRGYIIHRIVGGDEDGGWTTRGDGNTRDDRWTVPDDAIVGRELLVVPRVARAIIAAQVSPFRFAAIVGTAVTVLLLLSPSDRGHRADEPDAPDQTERLASRGPVVLPPDADAEQRRQRGRPASTGGSVEVFDEVLDRLDELLGELRMPE